MMYMTFPIDDKFKFDQSDAALLASDGQVLFPKPIKNLVIQNHGKGGTALSPVLSGGNIIVKLMDGSDKEENYKIVPGAVLDRDFNLKLLKGMNISTDDEANAPNYDVDSARK